MSQLAVIIPLRQKPSTSDTQMKQQPPRQMLADYQRSGVSWLACDVEGVRLAIDIAIASGQPLPEQVALMDLHYWIDRQMCRPHRYYAKRWGWGPKRVYNLFVRLGIYSADEGSTEGAGGEQQGSTEGAGNDDSAKKSQSEGAGGEQEGSTEGAGGEQYIPSSSPSSSEENSSSQPRTVDDAEPSKPQKKPKRKYATDQDAELVELLLALMIGNDPGRASRPRPDIEAWAEDINKLHRIDGHDYTTIEHVLRWCQRDEFWKVNILSAKKFREQFDRLRLKAAQGRNNGRAHQQQHAEAGPSTDGRPASGYDGLQEGVARELERKRRLQEQGAGFGTPSTG